MAAVAGWGCAREWLDLVEREHGYLLSRTRLEAEQRKDAAQKRQVERDAQHAAEHAAETQAAFPEEPAGQAAQEP